MPIQNRWNDIFENNQYAKILNKVTELIKNLSASSNSMDYFTPHDDSHCLSVEKMVNLLIEKCDISLTDTEKFILYLSVWTHDVGMLENIAKTIMNRSYSVEERRDKHDEISAKFLNEDPTFKKIFTDENISEGLFKAFTNNINIISKFHRRANHIIECPKERYIDDAIIKSRLIASLLRLGDTLHVDTSRFNKKLFSLLQFGNFDRLARLHWLKSYIVSSIYLDEFSGTVVVLVDLPAPKDEKDENAEQVERLKNIIKDNILEDLIETKVVFKEYKLDFFDTVEVRIHSCPGYSDNERNDIIGIMNDLDIILSPNTSRVMRKAIESIRSIIDIKYDKYEIFYNQLNQLLINLNRISESKPCHVGLKKIIKKFSLIFTQFQKPQDRINNNIIEEYNKLLSELISDLERDSGINIKYEKNSIHYPEISHRNNSERKVNLSQIKYIFLFGYSEMVIDFLYANRMISDEVYIYVFECSGKRKFSITNNIEYNDGIKYATELAKKGFKKIHLLPDTSFASLLNDPNIISEFNPNIIDKRINDKNSILLFGTNGIDHDESCGHTSGHLMMINTANTVKDNGIPVIIIASRFKKVDQGDTIVWKPELKREGNDWLSGDKNYIKELEKHNIKIINYKEDEIPADKIFNIIYMEDCNQTNHNQS
ncbi:MAG: hypothetical protein H7832_11180 [Magnetococcus sp. DMHC-6]